MCDLRAFTVISLDYTRRRIAITRIHAHVFYYSEKRCMHGMSKRRICATTVEGDSNLHF